MLRVMIQEKKDKDGEVNPIFAWTECRDIRLCNHMRQCSKKQDTSGATREDAFGAKMVVCVHLFSIYKQDNSCFRENGHNGVPGGWLQW